MIERHQRMLTTVEIAKALGVSAATVTRMAVMPDCLALMVRGQWRWPPLEGVLAWLRARTDAHRGHPAVHPDRP